MRVPSITKSPATSAVYACTPCMLACKTHNHNHAVLNGNAMQFQCVTLLLPTALDDMIAALFATIHTATKGLLTFNTTIV